MDERDGCTESRAVGSEPTDGLYVVLREGADIQGRALRELAKASTENSPALGQQAHRNAHPRRKVHAFDDIVAIGTHAQLEIQPIVDPPAVLGEKGQFGAADLGVRQSRGVGRSLGKRAIEPDDIELLAVVFAVEPGLLKVDADLEHVLAQPVILREREPSTTCRLRTLRSWRLKKLPLCPCGA